MQVLAPPSPELTRLVLYMHLPSMLHEDTVEWSDYTASSSSSFGCFIIEALLRKERA